MPKKSFSQIVGSEQPTLIDFYADWCQPCHALAPTIQQVAKKMDDIKVIKINIDKNRAVAEKYQIRSIPTLMLFQKGRVLWRESGVLPEQKIIQAIEAAKKYAS